MLTELEKAYLAGLFDGEGCISLSRGVSSYNDRSYHQLMITVGMANKEGVEMFHREFGGTFTAIEKVHLNPNWSTIYRWQVSSGKDCSKFLEVIGPYLRIKRPLVQLALDFISTIRRGRSPVTEDLQTKRDALYASIHGINQAD